MLLQYSASRVEGGYLLVVFHLLASYVQIRIFELLLHPFGQRVVPVLRRLVPLLPDVVLIMQMQTPRSALFFALDQLVLQRFRSPITFRFVIVETHVVTCVHMPAPICAFAIDSSYDNQYPIDCSREIFRVYSIDGNEPLYWCNRHTRPYTSYTASPDEEKSIKLTKYPIQK